jgi:3'(2'), 5'-bisphosphate nucleotidase
MTKSYEDELRIAELTVQRAVLLTKRVFASLKQNDSMNKEDNTVVTVADLGAQALIISAIHNAFPQDTFIGEESASMLRKDRDLAERVWHLVSTTHLEDIESTNLLATPQSLEAMLDIIDLGKGTGGSTGRVWVLDPIDGTATYIKGQQYAVCLCLVEDGSQKLGVLGCPHLALVPKVNDATASQGGPGYLVTAVKGKGAYMRKLSSGSLQPSENPPASSRPKETNKLSLIESFGSSSMNQEMHKLAAEKLGITEPPSDLWSSQMKYIALAIGGYDLMFRFPRKDGHRTAVWDHAPGQLIFEECGGRVTDMFGKDIDFGAGRRFFNNIGNVAAPAELHGKVMETVRGMFPGKSFHPEASEY